MVKLTLSTREAHPKEAHSLIHLHIFIARLSVRMVMRVLR